MELNKKNYEFYAFESYLNKSCFSKDEFYEDLRKAQYARKLAKKMLSEKEVNIRLLLNHIILFTNVFEMNAAKKMLTMGCNDEEVSVFKTVFTYLGFSKSNEMPDIMFNTRTALMLKELRL
jgi:hypothetical protein